MKKTKKNYAVSDLWIQVGNKYYPAGEKIEVTKKDIEILRKTTAYAKGKVTLL